jgi:hypothetical protein
MGSEDQKKNKEGLPFEIPEAHSFVPLVGMKAMPADQGEFSLW